MLRRTKPESMMFDDKIDHDHEKGIVRNVKIAGLKSKQGYRYTDHALKEALSMYEGVKVNINHPERGTKKYGRDWQERFGRHKNVRFVEGDGVRADFHYNTGHPWAPKFAWEVDNDPGQCGFSHNARGAVTGSRDDPRCESIDKVVSVDLVADPATTESLIEGGRRMQVRKKKRTRKEALKHLFEGANESMRKELLEEAAELATAEATADDSEGLDAIMGLIRPIVGNPDLDVKETIKKVGSVLKALADMVPGGAGEKKPPASDANEEVEEEGIDDDDDTGTGTKSSTDKLLEAVLLKLTHQENGDELIELCESLDFKPNKKQLSMLRKLDDAELCESMIETWKSKESTKGKPRSQSGKLVEGVGDQAYKDSKEFAKGLVA